MAFSPKTWQDIPSTSTPLSADALIDMEARLGAYADSQVATRASNSDPRLSDTRDPNAHVHAQEDITGLEDALAAAVPSYVTALPDEPSDGDEVYYAADATNGAIWHLRYRSGATGSYKWEYLGGPPLWAGNDATETGVTATSFDDLGTPVAVTAPLAGDYVIEHGACLSNSGSDVNYLSYSIDATPASDDDAAQWKAGSQGSGSVSRTKRKTIADASSVIALQIRVAGGSGTVAAPFLSVVPVRVG